MPWQTLLHFLLRNRFAGSKHPCFFIDLPEIKKNQELCADACFELSTNLFSSGISANLQKKILSTFNPLLKGTGAFKSIKKNEYALKSWLTNYEIDNLRLAVFFANFKKADLEKVFQNQTPWEWALSLKERDVVSLDKLDILEEVINDKKGWQDNRLLNQWKTFLEKPFTITKGRTLDTAWDRVRSVRSDFKYVIYMNEHPRPNEQKIDWEDWSKIIISGFKQAQKTKFEDYSKILDLLVSHSVFEHLTPEASKIWEKNHPTFTQLASDFNRGYFNSVWEEKLGLCLETLPSVQNLKSKSSLRL